MGENSKIEWTHHTFNPWWGCTKVSPGCANCYAETFSKRTGRSIWGKDAKRRFFGDKHWNEPLKWNAKAEAAGERRRVFCASMADVFEDREDLIEPRARLWCLIAATPALDWLLLTKRPENLLRMVPWMASDGKPWSNVWLGTSVENQKAADERIPHLLNVPAAVRFLSCEPLLGPVSIAPHLEINMRTEPSTVNIDWVVVGGESGPGARPMHPEWARSLRDQCYAAGVAFFFKQWGEWFPRDEWEYNPELVLPDDDVVYTSGSGTHVFIDAGEFYPMHKVGKQKAGRLLNGQTWNEFPKPLIAANIELQERLSRLSQHDDDLK